MTTPLSDERIAELTYRLKGPVTSPLDWWCEADDLFTVGCELLAEVSRLRTRNAELVEMLRSVEWAARDADDDGKPIETCPACRWWKTQGHHPQCDLDAALRDAHD